MREGSVRIAQVNIVVLMSAINRLHGGFADLSPDVIDYRVISPVLADAKFRSQRTIRTMNPKGAVLVYFSGKLLCVGTKTPMDAIASIYKAVRVLNNYRWPHAAEFVAGNISFVNSVFKGTCGHSLVLKALMGCEPYKNMLIRYEPDLFPGCVMTLLGDDDIGDGREAGDGSVVVYGTGRFVLAGCQTEKSLHVVIRTLNEMLDVIPGLRGPSNTDDTSETAEYQAALEHMKKMRILPELAELGI